MPGCKNCQAETGIGRLCKRLASCNVGCKKFCWQHAEMLGGGYARKSKNCRDPEMSECSIRSRNSFPCSKKNTIFWSKTEYNRWRNIKVRNGKDRKKIIKAWERRDSKGGSSSRSRRSRVIKFV